RIVRARGRPALVEQLLQETAPLLALVAVPVAVQRVLVGVVVAVRPRRVPRRRRRYRPVPGGLGVDQPLQLAPVEEDPPTVGTLVDRHAGALVLTHLTMALRTQHGDNCTRAARAAGATVSVPSPDAVTTPGGSGGPPPPGT